MSKRAAIYARVSTDLQRDNYSIPSQIAECLKYAAKRGYLVVGDQYIDPITGQDTKHCDFAVPAFVDDFPSREISRPSLDACLNYLETVGFDILIVHALDRLARDPYIRQTIEMDFNKLGVKIEYAIGSYDESPEGEVRKDLDATFAKWENAKRVERCNRGKMRKAQNGLFVAGRAPYGYKIDKNVPGGLVIVESEADVVKTIFHLYVEEKMSIRQITKFLTSEGISPPLGGKTWGKSTVPKILRVRYIKDTTFTTSINVRKRNYSNEDTMNG